MSGYGDYAAGDPFLGAFGRALGRVGKVLFRTAVGAVTGGIPGAILGAASGTASAVSSGVTEEQAAAVGESSSGTNPSNLPVLRNPGALSINQRPPGIITTSPLGTPVSPAAIAMQMQHLRGARRTHPNKSTYITRGGGTSRWPQTIQVHPKGSEEVFTRRMNVANPRALRRSLRRVAGFAKLTKRVRRAVSMAASSVGVRHRGRKTIRRR